MSTTQTEHPGHTAHRGPSGRPAPRARLISGRLALVLMSSFGALTSFYLLLSVTPMYAVSAGAGTAQAGLVTGSLMLATVLAEFAPPRLMRRYGYRTVFAAGAAMESSVTQRDLVRLGDAVGPDSPQAFAQAFASLPQEIGRAHV